MYEEHPLFKPPLDEAPLWHYMSFKRLVCLLDKQALFFSRVDKLGDPFEGSLPKETVTLLNERIRKWANGFNLAHFPANQHGEQRELFQALAKQSYPAGPQYILASCWHKNHSESDFMWKVYASENRGVAVKTDFGSLKKSIRECKIPVHIGKVRYLDYDKDCIPIDDLFPSTSTSIVLHNTPPDDLFIPCLHKRKAFESEREVRAIMKLPGGESPPENPHGYYYKVDLSSLVKEVFVAPQAEDSFFECVQSVVNHYCPSAAESVYRSPLGEKPVWWETPNP